MGALEQARCARSVALRATRRQRTGRALEVPAHGRSVRRNRGDKSGIPRHVVRGARREGYASGEQQEGHRAAEVRRGFSDLDDARRECGECYFIEWTQWTVMDGMDESPY